MKKLLAIALSLLPGICKAAPVDLDSLLSCIAQVENAPTNFIGAHGERSRYQMTGDVWYSYTNANFFYASSTKPVDLELQQLIALKHLRYLALLVERPTVYRLAAAWNGGAGAVNRGQFNDRMVDYAKRVRNLYEEVD